VDETDEFAIFEHQPCPRFRIAVPLRRPWLRQAYKDQRLADGAWKEGIEALAAALHLDHDQSCTDTSRLFYLPRRPPDGPPAETAVLEGEPCDIFDLPSASKDDLFDTQGARRRKNGDRTRIGLDRADFTVPDTGEVYDVAAWAREHGHEFQIVEALRARRPDIFVGKVVDNAKHHIRCVNESQHTQAGADAATFIVNAHESSNKGFVYHCRHGHCDGHDRLFFARRMLEAGWLTPADLTDARFLLASATATPDPQGTELTEHGIATVFTQRHRDDLRFCHTAGAWYIWTGTHWAKDETRLAFTWARQLIASLNRNTHSKTRATTGRAAFAAAVEQFAKADEAFAVTSSVWDRDPWLLCTPEGVVDLRTGNLRSADRANYMTKITAIAPTQTIDCPRWHRFLHEVTGGDDALIRFLQQWFGYTLTGSTQEEALLFVYGPGGNGKGKLLSAVQGILGTYCRTAAMETFTASQGGDRHPTDLAMLNGARMVCASETEEGRSWAEVRIKQLTGNDVIAARFMRRDFFEYRPQFKLTIIGNHKPTLKNVDDAARRRFNIVPFRFKPDPVDRQLNDKLRAEWPGILRWMIDGCLDWQQHGLLRPRAVLDATAEYFAAQDYFGRWLAECCLLDCTLSEKPARLLQSFQRWCEANGEPETDNRRMRGMIERTPGLRYATSKGIQWVRGIGLKPNDEYSYSERVEGGGGSKH
jgi:P4 family phage/plasmid primase-like protien